MIIKMHILLFICYNVIGTLQLFNFSYFKKLIYRGTQTQNSKNHSFSIAECFI
jgi:hypothetical protein